MLTVFIQDQKVIFQTVLSMPPSPLILWWWSLLNFLQNKSSIIRNEAGTVPGPTAKIFSLLLSVCLVIVGLLVVDISYDGMGL